MMRATEALYVRDDGTHFLRSLPEEDRGRIAEAMGSKDEAQVRLRLTSGQQFVLPLAIRTRGSVDSSLRFMRPVLSLSRLRRAYDVLKPILGRIGITHLLQQWAARKKLAVSLYDDSRALYITDDHLFASVGKDLLATDPVASAPKYIGVALTNRCNLACGMCPYHSPTEKTVHSTDYFHRGQLIDPADLKRILDYAERAGSMVGLGQLDEPMIAMLAPRYWPLFRDSKAAMTITTNGTLLKTKKDFDRICALKNLRSISISIDAATPETYLKIRGDDFQQLRTSIVAFFKHLKRKRPDIERRVCFVAQPDNRGEEKAFIEQWKPYVNVVSIYQMTQYETESGVVNFEHNYNEGRRTPCGAIFEAMYVMPGMEILPCCLFMYVSPYQGMRPIGKFDAQFWTSDGYHGFRTTVTEEVFHPICETCTVWKQGAARWLEEDGMKVSENPYERHYHVG